MDELLQEDHCLTSQHTQPHASRPTCMRHNQTPVFMGLQLTSHRSDQLTDGTAHHAVETQPEQLKRWLYGPDANEFLYRIHAKADAVKSDFEQDLQVREMYSTRTDVLDPWREHNRQPYAFPNASSKAMQRSQDVAFVGTWTSEPLMYEISVKSLMLSCGNLTNVETPTGMRQAIAVSYQAQASRNNQDRRKLIACP